MAETIVEYKKLSEDEQQYWRDFYEEIRKHDEASALGSARRKGEAKGEAKGIAKGKSMGIAEGEIEERNTIVENMRKNGFTEDQIKTALGDRYSD